MRCSILSSSNNKSGSLGPSSEAKIALKVTQLAPELVPVYNIALETNKIVIARLLLQNKLGRIWFFEETYLFANSSIKIVLKIVFFTLSNINIWFIKKKLVWKSYMYIKALPKPSISYWQKRIC